MALFELRQYKIKPGKLAQWIEFMEGSIVPYIAAKGMVMIGSFQHETDESVYIWIRRFDDEAHREQLYRAVYEDEHWKTVLSPQVRELIERESSVVQRLTPTGMSPLR